jgi:transposase
MDSHTDNVQVHRLEVVQTGRRRRWSEDEKLRIVLESLQEPRQASATARRHGLSPSLLFTWRRAFGAKPTTASRSGPGFVPAVVVQSRGRPASQGLWAVW